MLSAYNESQCQYSIYGEQANHWIKAGFKGKLKRLFDPPKDYDLLIKKLRSHFKELDSEMALFPEHRVILASDLEGKPLKVSSTPQLLDFYNSPKKRVPKFEISLEKAPQSPSSKSEAEEEPVMQRMESTSSSEEGKQESVDRVKDLLKVKIRELSLQAMA